MIPINLFTWILAFFPIILLLILMVGFKWKITKAALLSLIIAIINSIIFFKAPLNMITTEALKGIWSSLSVIFVVFPAILLYEVINKVDAFKIFRKGMQKLSPNELIQVLIIGWVFSSFLQGITGFGVPVAVCAPLLLGIGVTPCLAVAITLIGHAWANTFGTLGVAWNALVETTGMSLNSPEFFYTALWTAAFLFIINMLCGFIICWLYGKTKAIKKGFIFVLIVSFVQGFGQIIVSQINPLIATFVPTVVCLLIIPLVCKIPVYQKEWHISDSNCMQNVTSTKEDYDGNLTLTHAIAPYVILSILTFVALVIPSINNVLKAWSISFNFSETTSGYGVVSPAVNNYSPISPLVHPGLFLFISAVIGFIIFLAKKELKMRDINTIFSKAINKTFPSATSVILLLMMSKIMAGTGQIDVLARGCAIGLNDFYVIVSPFIGTLGSFITSSNMASNILFANFQQTTAEILGLNVSIILAAQTAGGAIGGIICPGNVVLGTTTAGILGKEGDVLKITIPIAVVIAILIGVFLLVIT